MKPEIRLSCVQCRTRKKKCDKANPCAACREAGLHCEIVQRARLPRGRSAKAKSANAQLEDRLARIEKLLQQVREPAKPGDKQNAVEAEDTRRSPGTDSQSRDKINRYVASDFWDSISREVSGLRDVFDVSDEEDVLSDSLSPEKVMESTEDVDDLLFPTTGGSTIQPLPHVSDFNKTALFEIFQQRVHSTYNVLHLPTLMKDVNLLHAGSSPTPRATSALESAVLFLTVCSLSEEESLNMGLGPKQIAMNQYRILSQTSLSRAGLIVYPSLTLLQAFLLYLNGLRACQSRASTWILLAVVVRLAEALGLGDEDTDCFSPFDLEVRRRLWFQIGVMDSHSALDRGTPLILPLKAFKTPPLDINDMDLVPGIGPRAARSGMTDMSISMITIEAMLVHRKLHEPPREGQDKMQHWLERLQTVKDMEAAWLKQYPEVEQCTPLYRLARLIAVDISKDLQLQLRRPAIHLDWHYVPPNDDYNVLESAIVVMERHLCLHDPDIKQWAWKVWVKWYALAILLAELCGTPQPDLVERGFAAARAGFKHLAIHIADSESGLLWRPIVKLMQRAEQSRKALDPPAQSLPPTQAQTATETGHTQPLVGIDTNLNARFSTMYSAPVATDMMGVVAPGINSNFSSAWTGDDMYNALGTSNDLSWQNWNMFLDDRSRTMINDEAMTNVDFWSIGEPGQWP